MRSSVSVCWLVAVAIQAGPVVSAKADEIDEALNLEAMEQAPSMPEAQAAPEETGQSRPLSLLSRPELESELLTARAEIERMKDIVRRILIANRREKQAMHYNIGCVMRAAGRVRDAERAFLDALAIDPRDPAVHYNLGILYDEDLDRSDKAKKHYQAFLDLAPDDKDAGRVYQWLTALQ